MDAPPSPLPADPRLAAADREAAVARLSAAFAHDVIPLDEFEQRVAAAYRATSSSELAALVADLPAPPASSGPGTALAAMPQRIAAVFGNVERGGMLEVPRRLEVRAVFGNVELDLSDAHFAAGVTEISVRAVCGNVELRLPADALVENHGGGTLASFTYRAPPPTRTTPKRDEVRIRITGRAVLGNVEIESAGAGVATGAAALPPPAAS